MKIKVMLISKMDRNIHAMRSMIQDDEISVIGESTTGSAALDKIENISPDIIIMSLGGGDTDVLSLAERITMHRPLTHVILLTEYLDVEILQSAMSVGVHNVKEFPKIAKDFGEYIKSVYQSESTRIKSLTQKQSLSWMSRVITVFGPKGGLGKTTIAVNLAVKLAEMNKKVALVDLDLQFGDAHIFLDIDPSDTIAELINEFFSSDIDTVRSFMTVHSSGVHLLASPKSPEYAEVISAEKIQSLLGLLRTYYDFVIVDTAPSFNDISITALESSSNIIFVTGIDISILKNSKLSISLMDSLKQIDKIGIVVNRAVDMNSITVSDVEKILGQPIMARVPSDYKVAVTALNRGEPFVIGAPTTKLSESIGEIVEKITGGKLDIDKDEVKEKPAKSSGLFGRK